MTLIVVHIGLGNGFSAYEFEPATVIVSHSYRIPCKPLIPVDIIYFDSFWTAEFHIVSSITTVESVPAPMMQEYPLMDDLSSVHDFVDSFTHREKTD